MHFTVIGIYNVYTLYLCSVFRAYKCFSAYMALFNALEARSESGNIYAQAVAAGECRQGDCDFHLPLKYIYDVFFYLICFDVFWCYTWYFLCDTWSVFWCVWCFLAMTTADIVNISCDCTEELPRTLMVMNTSIMGFSMLYLLVCIYTIYTLFCNEFTVMHALYCNCIYNVYILYCNEFTVMHALYCNCVYIVYIHFSVMSLL